ncbi:Cytidine deaminase [Mycoplasmopsis meleagridis]|uniref:Cytidine deaminase n=1 Tax=Mycoplasmopsis meleagridis ATCC 25294 TaxID=1264554 RepID=A0A0F5H1I1_9BACT|nr:cytidine deaminase [Mycoplasmopsis meleagridis]KKB26722.1 Cytidine deaminase [Mycoplasmopsis meleagridis ATCC 25294]KUH47580.1 cytidine deaminase [Mycoplasmopsis meleagridis]OAD18162.1 Cytidine deaminase [Mycoplasmopsis meleagridis]VEU77255.1 cytidine deaminase [Mycoplasmopsis meleagridis]
MNKIKKLQELLPKAYCPWSKFQVAAIAVDDQGREFYGVNCENAAFPSGLCAERSAFFGSVAYGGKVGHFKELYVMASVDKPTSPCAGCRQVITEFMPDDAIVTLYGQKGDQKVVFTVKELVPMPIRAEQIK